MYGRKPQDTFLHTSEFPSSFFPQLLLIDLVGKIPLAAFPSTYSSSCKRGNPGELLCNKQEEKFIVSGLVAWQDSEEAIYIY